MNSAPRLSLCMIVRNEAANLPACLDSVRDLASDIVVVDTGSTDSTCEIARQHGARIINAEWTGDFSSARNLALAEARGEWILVLDADEVLPVASRIRIHEMISSPARSAYNLVQKNELAATGAHVSVHIVRLFPRDARVRFERPIHEQVNTSLERAGIPIIDTNIVFNHSGYASSAVLAGKTERNRRIIEDALHRDPDGDPNLRYFYASTFFDTQQFSQAAREYEECARRSRASRKRLERAATLKAAQAWFFAGKYDKARALLPDHIEPGLHPLAAHLKAEIAVHDGCSIDAVKWQESVLSAPDVAYLPPESLTPLKFKAVLFLANHWADLGRKDIGVKLLRLAQDISGGKRDGASATLAVSYREALA
ncbi:glycosyltransferase family 2 protein [Rariglobus hedericola]|uniref:Glycosyltransferase family 2 protein n=1 Tax=Rariglobus hedericola TaxID=2597822 RepID=A0A556QPK1_9BACT|nr:glycosyltransferase family 2 protein [Rariglobus hedericola]TSJ78578.1 glycosyltransferase family 2 protein [Rariglobus hedericola]